jgi:hypothetical protein
MLLPRWTSLGRISYGMDASDALQEDAPDASQAELRDYPQHGSAP